MMMFALGNVLKKMWTTGSMAGNLVLFLLLCPISVFVSPEKHLSICAACLILSEAESL